MAWQPKNIVEGILELDFSASESPMTAELTAYQQHYGLNFDDGITGINHSIGFIQTDDFKIVTHLFKVSEAKGTVFLQHGYYDHVGLYGNIIKHCLQQGFNVFSYDLPGHGLSSGDRASINSFDQYDALFSEGLALIQKFLPGPIVAIGQSTGAAIIINYLLTRGLAKQTSPFVKIYLLAPLVRPTNWRMSEFYYLISKPFIKKMKRTFSVNSNNLEFLDFLKNHDPLQPLFLKSRWIGALRNWIKKIESSSRVDLDVQVIQGTCDGTVDAKHNMMVLEGKFTGFEVTYIKNGRHQLVNEEPIKLKQVLSVLGSLV
ncbi:MAG: lysophospholipase [Bermanella sp.]|jgi:lysophospholipase